MAILKLSKEELEIIRQDEADFITNTYAKDLTVQRLRPSDDRRVINNDEVTFNYIKDTISVIIPLANRNGTPLTMNLLASALGYNKATISDLVCGRRDNSIDNQSEREWYNRIQALIKDTLTLARADVESLQLSRKIDANSAAKAIKDIDTALEDTPEPANQTVSVKLVDDLS